MSPALVIGHPATLVASVILIPVILALAVFLPGNQFLPLASTCRYVLSVPNDTTLY